MVRIHMFFQALTFWMFWFQRTWQCLCLKHLGWDLGSFRTRSSRYKHHLGCYRTALMLGINEQKPLKWYQFQLPDFPSVWIAVLAGAWMHPMDIMHRFHPFLSSGKSSANRQFFMDVTKNKTQIAFFRLESFSQPFLGPQKGDQMMR